MLLESDAGRRLAVAVPESIVHAAGLQTGSTVVASVDALGRNREIAAKVVEMTPGADPAAHTYLVRLDLGTVEVPTGSTGRARVRTGERQAVQLPRSAVLSPGGLTLVVVRDALGLARTRAVTLGAPVAGDKVEVLSGLHGGEEVLLNLGMPPADGARVEEVQS